MRATRILLACLILLGLGSRSASAEPTVVVLLFDGFSPRYMEYFPTPTFDRLQQSGAWTHRLEPPFPSMSQSGGVSISTGCWPERHGIVSNRFLDPARGLYDRSVAPSWLIACEHMDAAARRQGLRTASLGWYSQHAAVAGSEEPIGDRERAAQVIRQLEHPPGQRPNLILAYFSGPDDAGHYSGMHSEAARAAVADVDATVARVLDAIDAQPDADEIQLLVTTDHGMVPVETIINIARVLHRHGIVARPVSSGTNAFLYFDDPTAEEIDDAVARLSSYDEFDVVRPESQPASWHLGNGPRVGDLIIAARPPYFIEDIENWPRVVQWLRYVGPDFFNTSFRLKSMHGYPADVAPIEGILYARGSGFGRGREAARVRAVDIHPTVMHLLGIEPGRPVDGEVLTGLLR